jgi:hypothetical protein
MQALGDSLDDRPTHQQVAVKHDALQQQMGGLTAELDAVKARLRGAGQDLQHFKDWQVGDCHQRDVDTLRLWSNKNKHSQPSAKCRFQN